MLDTNIQLLDEVIADNLKFLTKYCPDDEKYGEMVGTTKTLIDLRLTHDRICFDYKEKKKHRSVENRQYIEELKLKRAQLDSDISAKEFDVEMTRENVKDKHIDRKIKVGLEVISICLPLAVGSYWAGRGYVFEQTGVVTSNTLKGIIGTLKSAFKWK